MVPSVRLRQWTLSVHDAREDPGARSGQLRRPGRLGRRSRRAVRSVLLPEIEEGCDYVVPAAGQGTRRGLQDRKRHLARRIPRAAQGAPPQGVGRGRPANSVQAERAADGEVQSRRVSVRGRRRTLRRVLPPPQVVRLRRARAGSARGRAPQARRPCRKAYGRRFDPRRSRQGNDVVERMVRRADERRGARERRMARRREDRRCDSRLHGGHHRAVRTLPRTQPRRKAGAGALRAGFQRRTASHAPCCRRTLLGRAASRHRGECVWRCGAADAPRNGPEALRRRALHCFRQVRRATPVRRPRDGRKPHRGLYLRRDGACRARAHVRALRREEVPRQCREDREPDVQGLPLARTLLRRAWRRGGRL